MVKLSIVHPVWGHAPRKPIHQTHRAPQQIDCRRGNNKLLQSTWLRFQALDTVWSSLLLIFGSEVLMKGIKMSSEAFLEEKRRQWQTVFFPRPCPSKWRTVRDSITASEWVCILPLCQLLKWLFWRDRWKFSSFWEKGKRHQAQHIFLLHLQEGEEHRFISPLPATLADHVWKITSKASKEVGAPLLFPPHMQKQLWCWADFTPGIDSFCVEGGKNERTFRIYFFCIVL